MVLTGCFCFGQYDGVIFVGFLQLLACLYYWSEFSLLDEIYWPIQCFMAIIYSVRVIYFMLWLFDQTTVNAFNYYQCHQWTVIPYCITWVLYVVLLVVEWAQFPLWITVGYALATFLNIWNICVLKDYYDV